MDDCQIRIAVWQLLLDSLQGGIGFNDCFQTLNEPLRLLLSLILSLLHGCQVITGRCNKFLDAVQAAIAIAHGPLQRTYPMIISDPKTPHAGKNPAALVPNSGSGRGKTPHKSG
jgi:hypothetical protein